jgi:hypothetical protein
MAAAQQAGFLKRIVLGEPRSVVVAELRGQLRRGARFAKAFNAAALPSPASAAAVFAKAQQMQSDREREENEWEAALELQRLDTIERDEEGLWRRVDELIAGKTVKAYNQTLTTAKDFSAHFLPHSLGTAE